MTGRSTQFALLYVVGLIATVGVTIAAFALIGDGFDDKSSNYWISLTTLIWAEGLSFGFAIAWSLRGGSSTRTFPYNFAAISIIALYDVAVVLLALIALTPISSAWLGSLHLGAFLLELLALLAYFSGGMIVADITKEEVAQRVAYDDIVTRVQTLVDMAIGIQGDGASHIKSALTACREEVNYITADTVQGAEAADAAVVVQLDAVESMLSNLPSLVADDDAVLPGFDRQMQQLDLAIKQRESVMLAARI